MTKNVFNWNYYDITNFLKKNHFIYSHAKGSHHYYVGHNNGQPRIVQVPFHTSQTLKPKTFKAIVKQSGISLGIWLK